MLCQICASADHFVRDANDDYFCWWGGGGGVYSL